MRKFKNMTIRGFPRKFPKEAPDPIINNNIKEILNIVLHNNDEDLMGMSAKEADTAAWQKAVKLIKDTLERDRDNIGELDYLLGTHLEAIANEFYFDYIYKLPKFLAEKAEKKVEYPSREEMLVSYYDKAQTELREKIEKNIALAKESYQRALTKPFGRYGSVKRWHFQKEDVELRLLDLEYRQALLIEDKKARETEYKRIQTKYQELIKEINNIGHKAEYQLIWLLRKYTQRLGTELQTQFIPSSLREDHLQYIDQHWILGSADYHIQIKYLSLEALGETKTRNSKALRDAKAVSNYEELLVIDSQMLNAAWGTRNTNSAQKFSNSIKKMLEDALTRQKYPSQTHERFNDRVSATLLAPQKKIRALFKKKTPEQISKRKRLELINEIKKNVNLRHLVDFGVITQDQINKIPAKDLLKIKEQFIRALNTLVKIAGEDIAKGKHISSIDDIQNPSKELIDTIHNTKEVKKIMDAIATILANEK